MVFYRKYRPQTIDELDLVKVRERLNSILSKEVPHAFLFTGPKGLGKTSSARILAKAINCESHDADRTSEETKTTKSEKRITNSPPIEPCNKCEACISITNGSNLDVIEIDAASNRGIDEIRDLREKVKFSPSSLPKKVYIIDEVHMLTNDAFNALLKTLEEPPSHAIFILCTTELWKIPPTISSRTFNVSFEKPTKEELVRSMERIVSGEKLNVQKNVLEKVYKLSQGSFRDAAKILEELSLASGNNEITIETLDKVYNSESIEGEVVSLINFLSKKDTKKALEVIERMSATGIDFEVVNSKIVEILHKLLLKKSGLDEEIENIESLSVDDVKNLISYFNESYKDIKTSVLPQLPLELSIIRFCLDGLFEIKKVKTVEEKKISEGSKVTDLTFEEKGSDILQSTKIDTATSDMQQAENQDKHGDLFKPGIVSENFFASLLDAIKKDNHSIAGILRGCKLVSYSDTEVRFETKYKFHKDKLSEDKIIKIIEKRAGEILRKNIRIFVELIK